MTGSLSRHPLVLDTHIVLDLFVFQDLATEPLRQALDEGGWHWIATVAMRDELQRVLLYPQIALRLRGRAAAEVIFQFDFNAHLVPVAPKAPATCRDPDDQKFIDLAVAHQAQLLSKDKAVLCLKKRLLALGVGMAPSIGLLIPALQRQA